MYSPERLGIHGQRLAFRPGLVLCFVPEVLVLFRWSFIRNSRYRWWWHLALIDVYIRSRTLGI